MSETPLRPDEIHATGLTERMTVFTIVAVVVSAIVLGSVISYEMNRLLLSEESAKLEADAHLITLQFKEKINDISSDIRVLARTTLNANMAKERGATAHTDNNGSNREKWRERLAALLAATLANGHHYLGGRYIDVAGGGQNSVRVARVAGQVRRLTGARSRQPLPQIYLKEAQHLRPRQVFVMVTSGDDADSYPHHRPLVRAVTAVRNAGRLVGVITLSADLSKIANDVRRDVPSPRPHMFVYRMQPGHGLPLRVFTDPKANLQPGDIPPLPRSIADGVAIFEGGPMAGDQKRGLFAFHELMPDNLFIGDPVGILVHASSSGIVEDIAMLRRQLLFLLIGLVLGVAGVALLFNRRQVRPLLLLARAVERHPYEDQDFTVSPGSSREMQVLAKALNDSTRQVRAHTHALEVANKELEAFSYSIAHDLHAPLRAINGFSAVLQDELGEALSQDGRDYLRRIRTASLRMSELIDGLLVLSRVSRNALHIEEINLSALARQIAAELENTQPSRHVDWRIVPNVTALADPAMMRLLMQNLLGNAWKFTSKRDDARIAFGRRPLVDGREAYFVSDNGIGFEQGYADKLFQPFSRLHGDDEYPGTGIGLATVRRIVDRHNGSVWAEGAPGAGATILFSLNPAYEEHTGKAAE